MSYRITVFSFAELSLSARLTLALYRMRVVPEVCTGGGEFCAHPVKPFARGRWRLRWTRALCKFNCGKERC